MSDAVRVLLVGAQGRMGKAVAAAAARDSSLTIAAGLDQGDSFAPAIENSTLVRPDEGSTSTNRV